MFQSFDLRNADVFGQGNPVNGRGDFSGLTNRRPCSTLLRARAISRTCSSP